MGVENGKIKNNLLPLCLLHVGQQNKDAAILLGKPLLIKVIIIKFHSESFKLYEGIDNNL